MAHSMSAKKRIRQNEKRRERNKAYKSKMRTAIKKFVQAAEANDIEKAKELHYEAVKIIAKLAQKGVIHKNQASRRISRITLKLNSIKSA
jgi:small subunit ribosomal protein S20